MPRSSSTLDIGQLLIVGFDGTEMNPRLAALLTRVQPAGVILFARNISSPSQTWSLLRACQKCVRLPLLTCVDMEGGLVDRLKNAIAPAPSAAEVFATGDRKLFRRHGQLIGSSCRAVGFNLDLAPVVDLAFPASQAVMRSRSVSADPRQVVVYAREFLAGLRAAGVLGAAKHFPGLGEGNLDSHHHLPVIAKSLSKLWNQDLYPYRALRRDLPVVLVGHAAYPAVTRKPVPASLSDRWITGVLRSRIGFRGLIVSDDLEMGGVRAAGSVELAAVGHIRAGGDLALVCHQEEFVAASHQALTQAAAEDRRFAARAADSIQRLAAFKKKFGPLRPLPSPSETKLARLSRSLWEFGEQVRLQAIAENA